MGGDDDGAEVDAVETGSAPLGFADFAVEWQPSPLERLGTYLRARFNGQDWRSAALEGAVVLLIGSTFLEVVRSTLGLGSASLDSLIAIAGSAGNLRLEVLQPTLAVFVLALLRSPRLRLRAALRAVLQCVIGGLVILTFTIWVLALHSIATNDEDPGPPVVDLLSWLVASGAVAIANLALVRTDRTIG